MIRSGHKAGRGTGHGVARWIPSCGPAVGLSVPMIGRLGRCVDHFGRLPLHLPWRRLLKSSLAQGRLDLTR